MVALVEEWGNINSGSQNCEGLHSMCQALGKAFSTFEGPVEEIAVPWRKMHTGTCHGKTACQPKALALKIRPEAPIQVFLGGHMDTVFPKESSFQKVTYLNNNTMQGPGVSDMKSGLVIMLHALQAFEQTPWAREIGWEVLITPDEETGSIGSAQLLKERAKRNHVGLIFEPAYADGSYVSARKGSINYTLVVHGKAAHAGRDFHLGRSAIYALAHFVHLLEAVNCPEKGITVNVGRIEGGVASNIVPELALCHFNVRMGVIDDVEHLRQNIVELVEACQKREGIKMELIENVMRPPKPFDSATQNLFEQMKKCACSLHQPFKWQASGGVSDGNLMAAAGLPNIDTLGGIGGNIHTEEEYLLIDSLVGKASLVALFLIKLATREIVLHRGGSDERSIKA